MGNIITKITSPRPIADLPAEESNTKTTSTFSQTSSSPPSDARVEITDPLLYDILMDMKRIGRPYTAYNIYESYLIEKNRRLPKEEQVDLNSVHESELSSSNNAEDLKREAIMAIVMKRQRFSGDAWKSLSDEDRKVWNTYSQILKQKGEFVLLSTQ